MALAAWACDPRASRGRRRAEPGDPLRNDFQRDRDRIVHSTAFRRLVYKTQVFLNHEGDLFRTRLTHSLEVAQLGRSLARALDLNEDLVEAIALAHDLGHTPFGHAGQDALDACLRGADPASAGFEHNLQSLRVVDALEERYAAFDGLNLCFETREGILKRCSRRQAERLEAREPGGVAARFLAAGRQPSLEAQLANLADAIAYNAHDIDDGVRSGLVDLAQLEAVPLFERQRRAACDAHPGLAGRRVLYEALRRMLAAQVHDVIDATRAALHAARPDGVEAVRAAPALVRFSDAMRADGAALQRFLHARLYRHAQVTATTERAQEVIRALFDAYRNDPAQVPSVAASPPARRLRAIADHVAGMTDRFALREYERLTGRRAFAAL